MASYNFTDEKEDNPSSLAPDFHVDTSSGKTCTNTTGGKPHALATDEWNR